MMSRILPTSLLAALAAAAAFAVRWLRRSPRPGQPRRILYLGTGQIAQVFPRNGVNLFLERECSDFAGFFEQIWNVHFPAGATGALDLTPRHHLVDFDLPWLARLPLPKAAAMLAREVVFLAWAVPFARRHRIGVITATNPYLQGLNAFLLSRLLGIPYAVIVTRDYDWDWETLGKQAFPSVFPSRALEKRVERVVFGNAVLVLADRRFYRDYAVRNGARPERAVTTRVVADTAYELARPSGHARVTLGLPAAGPLLTYVGRLDPDKLAMDLVDCLALVRESYPDATLACAGTGTLEDPMRQRARDLGVDEGLRLLGGLPLETLADLVASSDGVVAAHMGYTLIEAGLTGVPIVTYDYDYHGEILEDGYSGYLAPFRDVRALADRVCAVLADPAAAREVGARARQRLLREHSLAVITPLYQQAYARLLGDETAAPVCASA